MFSTLGAEARSTMSQRHKSDPRGLTDSLEGELDWLVMQAPEEDRNRRYESAAAPAADAGFATRCSSFRDFIMTATGGEAIFVPEPTARALITLGLLLLVIGRLVKASSNRGDLDWVTW